MKNTRSKIIGYITILVLMVSILTGGISYDMPAAVCSAEEGQLDLSQIQPDKVLGGVNFYTAESIEENVFEESRILEAEKQITANELAEVKSFAKGEDIVQRDWNVYSSRYFYQQLSVNEKNLYRAMYVHCMYYLTTADGTQGSPANYAAQQLKINGKTGSIPLSRGFSYTNYGVTQDQASKVSLIFMYENPQFYFVNANVITYKNRIFLEFYALFGNSTMRAGYTNAVFNKIDEDAASVATETDTVQKIRTLQDRICGWTQYNWSKNMGYGEYYDQSVYSYAVMQNSVCAGNTKATMAIFRKAGIPTIGVTSSSHAWNMVKVGKSWYNLDVTWYDDIASGRASLPKDSFFLVSDLDMTKYDKNSGSHNYVSLWTTFGKPVCTSSYVDASSLEKEDSKHHEELDVSADFALAYVPNLQIIITSATTYTGGQVKPSVVVTANGVTFDPSQYYIEYPTSAVYIGEYNIYVELKEASGYSGSVEVAYNIIPKKTQIKKLSGSSKSFTVNYKKVTKQVNGYEIQYSLKKDFSSKKSVKVAGNKKTSKKISGLKSKKKYYVRVRTYKKTDDGKIFSEWSKVKTVKTK